MVGNSGSQAKRMRGYCVASIKASNLIEGWTKLRGLGPKSHTAYAKPKSRNPSAEVTCCFEGLAAAGRGGGAAPRESRDVLLIFNRVVGELGNKGGKQGPM